jgi:gliding motility-associated-like protein
MKKIIFILSGLFVGLSCLYGQTITIADADLIPLNCATFSNSTSQVFFDNGGTGANYGPNRRDTITLCPDLPNGPKLSVIFSNATAEGFNFVVDPTDSIYVFDGSSTNANLLGVINSATNPEGAIFTSTFDNNPDGCLTLVFHSDATTEAIGWDASIVCAQPPQPIEHHIEAYINGQGLNVLNPLDTGYVDICLGDSILLIAKPDFVNSLEANGFGYSQNINNVQFEWETANGWQGPNNDSIWFKPLIRSGYYMGLTMTDIFPNTSQTFCKIRVSQMPLFFEAGPVDNPICAHSEGLLLGGATSADTVGLEFPPGSFLLGGTVAGTTPLPDGSGLEHTTVIAMNDFADGALFTNATDLQSICLNIEHSYLGDLEVWLECPNGTEVPLINSYDPGHFPGGFNGTGTFLGDANDDDDNFSVPGNPFEYCFSTINASFGTMTDEFGLGNTVLAPLDQGDAMNPNGVYLPETSFAGFIGCPLNGDWTLTVRDNIGSDDGYIFDWTITFDSQLFPNMESYVNTLVDFNWVNDPTIIALQGDTAVRVFPDMPGEYSYTFEVIDDYGCTYDTTVALTVKDTVQIILQTVSQCDTILNQINNIGEDGVWSNLNLQNSVSFININDVNTTIILPESGVYDLVYTDLLCNFDDTIQVTIHPIPDFNLNASYIDCPNKIESISLGNPQVLNMNLTVWDPLKPQFNGQNNVQLPFGQYNSTIVSQFGCQKDTSFTIDQQIKIDISSFANVCDLVLDMDLNPIINPAPVGLDINGSWFKVSGPGNITFADATDFQTSFTVSEYGTYEVRYFEPICNDGDTLKIAFSDAPKVVIADAKACIGQPFEIIAQANVPSSSITWSTGETGNSIFVTEKDYYYATATNLCGTSLPDSALIDLRLCEMVFPNVFTPNSEDEINNSFQLVLPTDAYTEFKCQIFNRWGNLMYEFFSTTGKWDGKTASGDFVSPGAYYYKVSATTFVGDLQEYHGFLQVVQ